MSTELDTHGFPIGTGIFETMKTVDGKVIALGRHMRRALDSSRKLGIALPDEETLRSEISSILARNPYPIGRLRICFGDSLFHLSHEPYEERIEPARVNFYSPTVQGSAHKMYPYDNRYAILKAARDEGFDDSLLFNSRNEITETAVSNIALRIGNEWFTTPLISGILPGTIRAISIEECGVKVRAIHVSEIPNVKSAFLLSSLRIAQPISHIGEMKLEIGDASRELEAQIRAVTVPHSVG